MSQGCGKAKDKIKEHVLVREYVYINKFWGGKSCSMLVSVVRLGALVAQPGRALP
jgi:hypothetical protein